MLNIDEPLDAGLYAWKISYHIVDESGLQHHVDDSFIQANTYKEAMRAAWSELKGRLPINYKNWIVEINVEIAGVDPN